MSTSLKTCLLVAIFCLSLLTQVQAQVTVTSISTAGPTVNDIWTNMDTRNNDGTVDNANSLNQNTFAQAPLASPGTQALRQQTVTSSSKAQIGYLPTGGYGSGITTFSLEYTWHATNLADSPSFKLLIDTSDTNLSSTTANDRGENLFDKILVFEPYEPLNGQNIEDEWVTTQIDLNTGTWWVVDLDGSAAANTGIGGDRRTLADWYNTSGSSSVAAELSTGTIVGVQLGLGSGNPGVDSYVDELDYTINSTSESFNFGVGVVPEPTSAVLLLGAAGLLALRRRR